MDIHELVLEMKVLERRLMLYSVEKPPIAVTV